MTQAELLADTLDRTRGLTKYYTSLLRDTDPEAQIEANGIKLNSLYWLTAHLMWAEDNLAIQMTGRQSVAPEWIEHYCVSSNGTLHEGRPDFKTLLAQLKQVHELSLAHIKQLTDEDLDKPNPAGMHFGDGNTSRRVMLQHAIRHEGTHVGHLGWLCKLQGIKGI
jgi:hypothetical protein